MKEFCNCFIIAKGAAHLLRDPTDESDGSMRDLQVVLTGLPKNLHDFYWVRRIAKKGIVGDMDLLVVSLQIGQEVLCVADLLVATFCVDHIKCSKIDVMNGSGGMIIIVGETFVV